MYHNGKSISQIFHLGKNIPTAYQMGKIVWEAIKSCFGRGFWSNDVPWNNDEAWNNGE